MSNKKNEFEKWVYLILGVLAIFAIKAIFEHDRSKIISKKGSKFLSDEDKMGNINKKIKDLESNQNQQEILI